MDACWRAQAAGDKEEERALAQASLRRIREDAGRVASGDVMYGAPRASSKPGGGRGRVYSGASGPVALKRGEAGLRKALQVKNGFAADGRAHMPRWRRRGGAVVGPAEGDPGGRGRGRGAGPITEKERKGAE